MKHSLLCMKNIFFNKRLFAGSYRNFFTSNQSRMMNHINKMKLYSFVKITQAPNYKFSTLDSDRKVTPKILCDIIGTKYYPHNEEIDMGMNTLVRLFDENDNHIGVITLAEAREKATENGVDLVLRNANHSPPVLKIMNYRKELLKRLFQKLGKKPGETEGEKVKTIKLTTQISVHDLENKKRQAIQFLKKSPILKFYIKVNQYDPENIQKGRIMLTNIAEELRSYAKVKVAPTEEPLEQSAEVKQKPAKKTFEDFKTEAERKLQQDIEDKDKVNLEEPEEEESGLQNVYMELESTSCYDNMDVDSIVDGVTLEDFLQNLYKSKDKTEEAKEGTEEQKDKPELTFGGEEDEFTKAKERIKLKKRLRKRSAIFDTTEIDFKQEGDLVDLTEHVKHEDQNLEVDEYDLLQSNINPLDVETLKRVQELRDKIEFEKAKQKGKAFFKMFRDRDNDPLGIHKEMQKEIA